MLRWFYVTPALSSSCGTLVRLLFRATNGLASPLLPSERSCTLTALRPIMLPGSTLHCVARLAVPSITLPNCKSAVGPLRRRHVVFPPPSVLPRLPGDLETVTGAVLRHNGPTPGCTAPCQPHVHGLCVALSRWVPDPDRCRGLQPSGAGRHGARRDGTGRDETRRRDELTDRRSMAARAGQL